MKTIEEKELLLKDLCARLPYNLKVCYKEHEYGTESIWNVDYIIPEDFVIVTKLPYGKLSIKDIKPYLRSMPSMTEEEKKELREIAVALSYNKHDIIVGAQINSFRQLDRVLNLFNLHHFDYRGLIEKGLALEAPEGMYNIKEK